MRDFVDAYMRVTVVMQMTNILSCEKQGNIEQCYIGLTQSKHTNLKKVASQNKCSMS
mgnify:CR=1 FL=1